jgi:hypothetical protein
MTKRGRLVAVGAAVLVAVFGGSTGVGFAAPGEFDWSVAALVLTAFGTLALAGATAYLAASTWQDVRASQRLAEAAIESNELVRTERERRPQLTLLEDKEKLHSHFEVENELVVRLLVANAPGMRAATGTQVLVDRCVTPSGDVVTFGSPALGWSSAAAPGELVVIFAGAARVVDLGTLIRKGSDLSGWEQQQLKQQRRQTGDTSAPPWELRIGLPLVGGLFDRREHVGTGTTIRLIVGSEESDAVVYDVLPGFQEWAPDTESLLSSLRVTVSQVEG